MFTDCEERTAEICGALFIRGPDVSEFFGSLTRVRNEFERIDLHDRSQTMALLACAVGGVERKRSGLEWGNADAAIHTCHSFRVELLFAIDNRYQHCAAR